MRQLLLITTALAFTWACKDDVKTDNPKPTLPPESISAKPVLPEGDFKVVARMSTDSNLTVAWSNPKDLNGGLSYVVYLGDKELGKSSENHTTADVSGNRFVNGRVVVTDARGKMRARVFLAKGDSGELVYIPDPVFEKYLIDNHLDHDGLVNSQMSVKDAMLVKKIEYDTPFIDNLIGVEAFTNLEILKCVNSSWREGIFKDKETIVDLYYNSALKVLFLDGNRLHALDISQNLKLEKLSSEGNELLELNLKGLKGLKLLRCSVNQLTDLDISNNTNLEELYCHGNRLTKLDVSKNANLMKLRCSNNQLSSLDMSENIDLTELYCDQNQLASLDVRKNINLETLWCRQNKLDSLNVRVNVNLKGLYCHRNQLSNLDLSKNVDLVYLNCSENHLTNLDMSNNVNLGYLDCLKNRLTNLDMSKNANLEYLDCASNQLKSIDLGKKVNLYWLHCSDNQLTNLDVSTFGGLNYLNCQENPNLKTVCVVDAEKAKAKIGSGWEKDISTVFVKCN